MNYIKCPNCGKEISAKSNSCIYCGISRGIIEQEMKIKELKDTKELPSKVEGFYNNNKRRIVILEILILVVAAIIYASSYLPKIMEYAKIERLNNMIEKCKNYGGVWNENNSNCETEVGIIDMN